MKIYRVSASCGKCLPGNGLLLVYATLSGLNLFPLFNLLSVIVSCLMLGSGSFQGFGHRDVHNIGLHPMLVYAALSGLTFISIIQTLDYKQHRFKKTIKKLPLKKRVGYIRIVMLIH